LPGQTDQQGADTSSSEQDNDLVMSFLRQVQQGQQQGASYDAAGGSAAQLGSSLLVDFKS
jgi:hypothetical protein